MTNVGFCFFMPPVILGVDVEKCSLRPVVFEDEFCSEFTVNEHFPADEYHARLCKNCEWYQNERPK
jgi:hypothetical protein